MFFTHILFRQSFPFYICTLVPFLQADDAKDHWMFYPTWTETPLSIPHIFCKKVRLIAFLQPKTALYSHCILFLSQHMHLDELLFDSFEGRPVKNSCFHHMEKK